MGKLYEETFEEAKVLAIETSNIKLMSLLLDPEDAWTMLDYFIDYTEAQQKDDKTIRVHPYHKDFKRWGQSKRDPEKTIARASYVDNVKTAIRRYDSVKKALATEPDHSIYREYQTAELDILNAYAIRVIIDLVKSNPQILDGISEKMTVWNQEKADKKASKTTEAE